MKQMSLVFSDTGWDRSAEDKEKAIPEITKIVVGNVVAAYATQKNGLAEDQRRLFYKTLDAIEIAVKDKKTAVSLEDEYAGFLKMVFREVRLTPSVLLRRVEELIFEIKDR